MKTKRALLIGFAALLLSAFVLPDSGYAQRKGPPPWAPAHGYRAKKQAYYPHAYYPRVYHPRYRYHYVYYPRYNFYYDNFRGVYIYLNGGRWAIGARLPVPLRRLDLGNCYRVGLNVNTNYPQYYNENHRRQYRYEDEDDNGYNGGSDYDQWYGDDD